jgi:hypothetical protein
MEVTVEGCRARRGGIFGRVVTRRSVVATIVLAIVVLLVLYVALQIVGSPAAVAFG